MSTDAASCGRHRRYDRAWWATLAAAVVVNTLLSEDFSPWVRAPVGIAFLMALVWLLRASLRERERARTSFGNGSAAAADGSR
jgi:Flp pilus assembly protein TadB